jgi:hypothetical protein
LKVKQGVFCNKSLNIHLLFPQKQHLPEYPQNLLHIIPDTSKLISLFIDLSFCFAGESKRKCCYNQYRRQSLHHIRSVFVLYPGVPASLEGVEKIVQPEEAGRVRKAGGDGIDLELILEYSGYLHYQKNNLTIYNIF